jgi:hypothetical protein
VKAVFVNRLNEAMKTQDFAGKPFLGLMSDFYSISVRNEITRLTNSAYLSNKLQPIKTIMPMEQ